LERRVPDAKNNLVAAMHLLSEEEMKTFTLYYGDEMDQHGIKYEAQGPPSSQGDSLGLDMMIYNKRPWNHDLCVYIIIIGLNMMSDESNAQ
jgi:hypothetical protein